VRMSATYLSMAAATAASSSARDVGDADDDEQLATRVASANTRQRECMILPSASVSSL
jgi:hypothetical protein